MRKLLALSILGCVASGALLTTPTIARAQDAAAAAVPAPPIPALEEGFVSLFDGTSLAGWKANERPESFQLVDGNLVVNGERGHLFYEGDGNLEPFVNFEIRAQVMTMPNSNSGLFIHTRHQPDGWPRYGYECQINSTQGDSIKTGSVYNVVDVVQVPTKAGEPFTPGVRVDKNRVMLTVAKAPSTDNEWFTYTIRVEGKRVITKVNGITQVDYTEPDKNADDPRKLDKGTFAIQAHDPKSKVLFRSVQVKRLP